LKSIKVDYNTGEIFNSARRYVLRGATKEDLLKIRKMISIFDGNEHSISFSCNQEKARSDKDGTGNTVILLDYDIIGWISGNAEEKDGDADAI